MSPHKKLAPSYDPSVADLTFPTSEPGHQPPERGYFGQFMSETSASGASPNVSVIVPVRNEAGNIAPLIAEIATALGKGLSFEIIYVNDGSTDRTESDRKSTRLNSSH